jgi:alkylation response protein AidB-like acyl-CoA dehydrogenase
MMSNLLVNMRDQNFVLFEQLEIEKLFTTEKYKDFSRDDVLMMINEAEKMALNVILPTYELGDKQGCSFKDGKVTVPECYRDAYKKYCEAGWLAQVQPVDVGGQGLPFIMATANMEPCYAANFAFLMYPGLTHGAAALILHHGTEELKNKYMYKMFAGEWGGTMCLTEPGAGSDLGAMRTTAKRLPDGKFLISGTKCFISCGDHDLTPNIVHPVLARIEGDLPGTPGISIFIVPKHRVNDDGSLGEFNDVKTGNIEHKMGIKGSATCTLNFGEDNACIGELLGKEREGLRIMFQMMNEARMEVGMQALGHSTAALEHSVAYAKERIQSTPVWEMKNPEAKAVAIIQHPDVRRDLLWMKAYVEGLRALNYFTAYALDMSLAFPAEKAKWFGLVELLTPICKAYSSDMGMLITSKAIDIYGGYGFCQEYPVEQYMRDCKIACLYEGTNGIQALDLVGRKLGQNKGMAYLEEANNALVDVTMTFAALGKSSSFMIPILNASPYLEVFGDLLLGHFLLQAGAIAQEKLNKIYVEKGADTKGSRRALVHNNPDVAFYEGKIASAKFFAVEVVSLVKAKCAAMKVADKVPIEIADESFAA